MHAFLERLARRVHLTLAESEALFRAVVLGSVDPSVLAALLALFRAKGETADELAGAARALRDTAEPLARGPAPIGDTCGTGGDGACTLNVSTAAALVCAAAGLPIAKHGNRAVSSASGSADVLEALGADIDVAPSVAERALRETGFCFLFAPRMHPGVRHAMPVRRALRMRTIFNLLGPLVNPARPEFQLLGTPERALVVPLAETLRLLGCRAALVVFGDGIDELALHGSSTAALLRDGAITELELTPEDAGIPRAPRDALAGGSPQENAAELEALLLGRGRPAFVSAVCLNAGALLWVSGRAPNLGDGALQARAALESGGAAEVLARYKEVCRASRAA